MGKTLVLAFAALFSTFLRADPGNISEISLRLSMTHQDYVAGERVRAELEIVNGGTATIELSPANPSDRVFVELYRGDLMHRLERVSGRPFTAPARIGSGERQTFEVFLDRHYPIEKEGRYIARPVLVHGGMRYEGALKAFTVVPGMKISGALQMFAERTGLRREFELAYWHRDRREHLFIKVRDEGPSPEDSRIWSTTDLGAVLRVTSPKIQIKPTGEVVVLHRGSQDEYVRSVFWSLPDAFEFEEHEALMDPETAGTERVKQLYQESSGVEPVRKAWWKFW